MPRVEYSSNNSGGGWWLKDEHWLALEAAGWKVDWEKDKPADRFHPDGHPERFLGALATSASREGLSLGDAIEEWERLTGENSSDLGCSCCGTPHSFALYEGDTWVESYSPSFPMHGDRYDG